MGGYSGNLKNKPQTDLSKGGFATGGSTDPMHKKSYNPNWQDHLKFREEARKERSKLPIAEQIK
jgi:hypothetical protein